MIKWIYLYSGKQIIKGNAATRLVQQFRSIGCCFELRAQSFIFALVKFCLVEPKSSVFQTVILAFNQLCDISQPKLLVQRNRLASTTPVRIKWIAVAAEQGYADIRTTLGWYGGGHGELQKAVGPKSRKPQSEAVERGTTTR